MLARVRFMSTSGKITSKKIRNLFRAKWPGLKVMWITDREYIVPKINHVRKMVKKCSVAHLPRMRKLSECEEYALLLAAAIRKSRIEVADLFPPEERMNWAFGFCGLSKYRGSTFNHTVCFAITDVGLYMFDAQIDDEGWKASDENDKVYAIFM